MCRPLKIERSFGENIPDIPFSAANIDHHVHHCHGNDMFHSLFNPIALPSYEFLKLHEGKGNYAISKYYRKKLYMIRDLLDEKRIYDNILDFGSGPGIFEKELKRHALKVAAVDKGDQIDPRARFECIVCASSLEFVDDLDDTVGKLYKATHPKGQIIIGSPMDSALAKAYFWLIGDKKPRHKPDEIVKAVKRKYLVSEYREWAGLYFALRAYKP